MDTEHEKTIINQHDLLLDDELADIFDDEGDGNAPKYENAEKNTSSYPSFEHERMYA